MAQRIAAALRWALIGCAVTAIGVYVVLAILRLPYPFELEWIEGGFLESVRRAIAGERLYVAPTLDYVPSIYPPLYFYFSAAAAFVVGPEFAALRLVSLVSSIGCFAAIFLLVKRETRDYVSAIVAVGLFAALFRAGGAWLDVGRVDSLFLALLFAGFYLLRFSQRPAGLALAGATLALAILTKQQAVVAATPAIAWAALRARRRAVFLLGGLLLVAGGSTLLLDFLNNGWYTFYTFRLPSRHENLPGLSAQYWQVDLPAHVAIAAVFTVAYLFATCRREPRATAWFYAAVLFGCVGASWMSRIHWGGYDNVLLPAFGAFAVCLGVALGAALEWLRAQPNENRIRGEAAICAAALLQFAILIYDPRAQLPTAQDFEAGRELVQRISKLDGDVFVAQHPHLAVMAGKRTHAHWMQIYDVTRSGLSPVSEKLAQDLATALQERRFGAIVLNRDWDLGPAGGGYAPAGRAFSDEHVFWPVTGMRTRPDVLLRPIP